MSCNGCSINNSANTDIFDSYSWLNDLPDTSEQSDIIEVKFKTTRREYFTNSHKIFLKRGDKIVVSTSPGHDVGEVTLTGYLAEKQFKRKIKSPSRYDLHPVFRKSTPADMDLLQVARNREKPTMIRARQIVQELGLDMKIGDVEFRGDNKKAIFYYLAEGRVDFRELIKVYALEFGIKIEMKQIGARQEAGIIGGIGSCGRELCCSSWRTDFTSISSDAAIQQGLSPSALKMAGACGKLKCCLTYELDIYIEARNEFPKELLNLEFSKGIAKPIKTDFLKKEICYTMGEGLGSTFNLNIAQVKDIIYKNKRGIKPDLADLNEKPKSSDPKLEVVLDGRIDRFDKSNNHPGKNRRKNKSRRRKPTATPGN